MCKLEKEVAAIQKHKGFSCYENNQFSLVDYLSFRKNVAFKENEASSN
tara:strand:- start:287 stop:430 length:144 start_codon:yes stop_codon:yes gene_type:complete